VTSTRRIATAALLLLLAGTVWAAASHDCGSYMMRYRVAASSALSAESLELLDVSAQPNVGVINVMLLDKGSKATVNGRIQVIIKQASGMMRSLKLRQIDDKEGTLFYAAKFDYTADEALDFELSVSALGQPPQTFSFTETLQ